jgi:hypothetical protein
MVNRTTRKTDGNLDKQTRQHAAAFSSSQNHAKDNPRTDDVIVSLANAHENRRARQVNEWERRQHSGYVTL